MLREGLGLLFFKWMGIRVLWLIEMVEYRGKVNNRRVSGIVIVLIVKL